MAGYDWSFDPKSNYGAQGGSQVDMPVVSGPNGFLANNEDAAYYRVIAPWASDSTGFSQFVRGKLGEVLRNFRAAQATNSNLQILPYLQQHVTEQSMRKAYQDVAPWLRPEAGGPQMGTGRMRWYQGSR